MSKYKIKKPNVVSGGKAIPLGANYYYMTGRKHSSGGIDIGENPRTGLEVEDGEVMHISDKEVKVFSSVPFLNGKSPAQKVMGGENPTKVFNQQEAYKDKKGLNDDGTKKKVMGGEEDAVNNFITKKIQERKDTAYKKSMTRELPKYPFNYGSNYESPEQWMKRTDKQIADAKEEYEKKAIDFTTTPADKRAAREKYDNAIAESKGGYETYCKTHGLEFGNSCTATFADNYGMNFIGGEDFRKNHRKYGFKKKDNKDVSKGDAVLRIDKGNKSGHTMMYVGKRADGRAEYNHANGSYRPSDVRRHATYPLADNRRETYEFVGTPQDSIDWKKEYYSTRKRMGGLSRKQDYGSKSKPYPKVKTEDFAGSGRSYPIPTKDDAIDALRLAGLHGRSDVKAKVYNKYPELRKKAKGGGLYSVTVNGDTKLRMIPSTGEDTYSIFNHGNRDKAYLGKRDVIGRASRILREKYEKGEDVFKRQEVNKVNVAKVDNDKQETKPVKNDTNNVNNKVVAEKTNKDNKAITANKSVNTKTNNTKQEDSNNNSDFVNKLLKISGFGTIGAGTVYAGAKWHERSQLMKDIDETINANISNGNKTPLETPKSHNIKVTPKKGHLTSNSPIAPKGHTKFEYQFKQAYTALAEEDAKLNKTGQAFYDELEKRVKAGEVKRGNKWTEVEQRQFDKLYKKAVGNKEPRSGFGRQPQATEISYTPNAETGRTYDATAEINQQRMRNQRAAERAISKENLRVDKASATKQLKNAFKPKNLKGMRNIASKVTKGFKSLGVIGDFIEPIYNTLFASPEEQRQIRINNYYATGDPRFLEDGDIEMKMKCGGKQKLKYGGRRKALYGTEDDNTTKVWLPSIFGQKYDKEIELPTITPMTYPFIYNPNNTATANSKPTINTTTTPTKETSVNTTSTIETKPEEKETVPETKAVAQNNNVGVAKEEDIKKDAEKDIKNKRKEHREKIGNFINNYGSDILGLTSNTIGGLVSHSMNRNMLNELKYNSQPIARQAAKLKTRININPQLDKMRESLAAYEKDIDNNTASSRVALARKQRARLANMLNTNELFGNKENIETELINKDRLNQQEVTAENIKDYNDWREKKVAFENAVREKKAENDVSLINTLNAGVQDVIGRREKRKSENKTILAMMDANPNLPLEVFLEQGLINKKQFKLAKSARAKQDKNKKD